MKRMVIAIAILAVAGSVAFGQSTQVLSRNAVGYVKKDLVPGYNLLANNWVEVGAAGLSVQDVVDTTSMKKGVDNLILWDANPPAKYITLFLYNSPGNNSGWDGKWAQATPLQLATNILFNGDAFWIRNRATSNVTTYIMGEVPDDDTNTFTFVPGYNFFSSSFSADMPVNDPSLNWSAGNKGLDNLVLWDPNPPAKYITLFLYNSPGNNSGWDGKWAQATPLALATNIMRVGEGAWYRNRGAGNVTWNEPRPYTWPAE